MIPKMYKLSEDARVVVLPSAPEFKTFTFPRVGAAHSHAISPVSAHTHSISAVGQASHTHTIRCTHRISAACPLCAPLSSVTKAEPPTFPVGTYVWSSIPELRPVIQGAVIGPGKRGTLVRLLDPIPWLPKDRQWEVDVPSLKLEKPSLLDRLAFEERMVPVFRRGFRPRLTKARVLLGL